MAREDQVDDQGLKAGLTVRVLDKDGKKIARYDEGQTGFPPELRSALRAFGERHPDARFIDVEFGPGE
jgi:hypothetical protein